MELRECPFCGGEATFDYDDNGWNWIVCGKCGTTTDCRTHTMEDCHPLLAEQWNRRSSPASAPEGWRLVPVEPTEEMKLAWVGHKSFEGCYRAMLIAAPTPPVSEDRKDAELLDYIQNHGATIQLVPMANRTFGFEVGGLHKSRKLSVREAIDAAMQEDKP